MKSVARLIEQLLGTQNTVAVPQILIRAFEGDHATALFCAQLAYWSGVKEGDWFYKSHSEWWDEICITKYSLSKATNKLKDLGFLETKLQKVDGAPTVHYKFDTEEFLKWIFRYQEKGFAENEKTIDLPKSENPTYIDYTETTYIDPTESGESPDPESEKEKPSKTEQQHLAEQLNGLLREKHNVRLTKQQFSYHVGKFRDILAGDDPSPDELERVLAHMISVYPKFPKMDARLALQDVRLGRDTGEAWEGPQPWERNGEPVNPHSTEGQKLRDKKRQLHWYMSAYDGIKEEKIKGTWEACSTHTDIINILERRK